METDKRQRKVKLLSIECSNKTNFIRVVFLQCSTFLLKSRYFEKFFWALQFGHECVSASYMRHEFFGTPVGHWLREKCCVSFIWACVAGDQRKDRRLWHCWRAGAQGEIGVIMPKQVASQCGSCTKCINGTSYARVHRGRKESKVKKGWEDSGAEW